jgi:hypothetical protein
MVVRMKGRANLRMLSVYWPAHFGRSALLVEEVSTEPNRHSDNDDQRNCAARFTPIQTLECFDTIR